MRFRFVPAVLAATALAVAVTVPSLAGATAPPDAGPAGTGITGEYVGSIGLNGGFAPDFAALSAETGSPVAIDGSVVFLYEFIGPISITMTDGAMDGSWTMAGTGLIDGEVRAEGAPPIRLSGDGVFDGTGTVSGTPGNYRFDSTFNSATTVSIENPVFGTTSDSGSQVDTFSTPLTSVAVACDQISGRWDYEINEAFEGINFDSFLNGYFTAVSAPEDAQEAVRELTEAINAWAESASSDSGSGSGPDIIDALLVLDLAQRVNADLEAAGGCTPPCDFTTPMNFAAADYALSALENQPGSTGSYLVSLLLGSGSLSDCDPGLAEQLRQTLIDDLNTRIDDLLVDGAEQQPDWIDQMIDAARTAQMLGTETFGSSELSPREILIAFGG